MATVTRRIIINGTVPPTPDFPITEYFFFRPGWMSMGGDLFSYTAAYYGVIPTENAPDPDSNEDYYVTMPDHQIIVTPLGNVTLSSVFMIAITGTVVDGLNEGYEFEKDEE